MINRQVGVTFSTWNRKLDTGDFKDYVITDAEAFAYGSFAIVFRTI